MLTWFNQTSEQSDFNWYKFLSQSLLCLTLLPLLLGLFAVCTALWAASLIAGLHGVAKSVSPFGMISGINSLGTLVAVVFPRFSHCEQTPTVRLTIQAQDGERPAIIKGELVSGTFRRGDDLELFGEWRTGTLVVQRGHNRSLATAIELRRDHWQAIFFTILSVIIIGTIFILSQVAHQ